MEIKDTIKVGAHTYKIIQRDDMDDENMGVYASYKEALELKGEPALKECPGVHTIRRCRVEATFFA